MSAPPPNRRLRSAGRAVALTACLGLTASLSPGLLAGAAHAAPAEDCAEAFPVADLQPGDSVTGLTVSQGTIPDGFTGEVLGVLKSGVWSGRDLVLAKLDSPAIEEAGIWSGMSGSPVYAEDGRLIGAVAYTMSGSFTSIAGITPFEYMDDHLGSGAGAARSGAPKKHVEVDKKSAKLLAASGEVTVAQASRGLDRLPMPMSVSGVSQARLDGLKPKDQKKRAYLRKDARAAGAGTGGGASIDTVAAGGNLAALLSHGDVSLAGVGTATSVCNGRVVGFGHPWLLAGPVSYGLAAADAVVVQPDPVWSSFKVANVGELGGTITDDRVAGVAGDFDGAPEGTVLTSEVRYGDAERTGRTDVFLSDALAEVGLYGVVGNHDVVMDRYGAGSETQSLRITGTDEAGKPFTIDYADRFASDYDISAEVGFTIADALWVLSSIPDVEVAAVTSKADVSDESRGYRVTKVEQKVDGSWVKVKRRITVKAGSDLKFRVTLTSKDKTRTVRVDQAIPKKAAGGSGWLSVLGGDSVYLDIWGSNSVAEFKKALKADPRNDTVAVQGGLRKGKTRFTLDATSPSVDKVVRRGKYVSVTVEK